MSFHDIFYKTLIDGGSYLTMLKGQTVCCTDESHGPDKSTGKCLHNFLQRWLSAADRLSALKSKAKER